MANVLVLANETIGGKPLLDAILARHEQGDARFFIVVPRTRPKYGNVIYDEAVRSSAQVRVDLALAFARQHGMEAQGETGDEDPFNAAMDAIDEHRIDEVIISTHPQTSSGWMRRDLPERIREASDLPVNHVVVDIANEGLPFDVTLVVAARTASGDELMDFLKKRAGSEERRRLFIIVVPQEGGEGHHTAAARARLAQVLDLARAEGLVAAGMIGDPDPYTATMNAIQLFRISDVLISTLAATKSGWLRADLIGRVRKASGLPVEHIEAHAGATVAT